MTPERQRRRAPETAKRMVAAVRALLSTLDAPREKAIRFELADDERQRWNYRPDGVIWQGGTVWHEGLRLVNMTPEQQRAALALLDTGLSDAGASRARAIMALEQSLRETERVTRFVAHTVRDPELYSFAIFGEPGSAEPWAWRAGGHHLALSFTLVDHDLVAPTPLFFGANPARVRHGSDLGLRTLPEEEDRARELLRLLDASRRARAVVSARAPGDILTDAWPRARADVVPAGLPFAAMSGDERERLVGLVRLYVDRAAPELAASEWRRIEEAGLDAITFAWAGSDRPDDGHYYAVKGPTFALEYDKTQDGANHVHTVWRDFTGDWGDDLLALHYDHAHRSGHGH